MQVNVNRNNAYTYTYVCIYVPYVLIVFPILVPHINNHLKNIYIQSCDGPFSGRHIRKLQKLNQYRHFGML